MLTVVTLEAKRSPPCTFPVESLENIAPQEDTILRKNPLQPALPLLPSEIRSAEGKPGRTEKLEVCLGVTGSEQKLGGVDEHARADADVTGDGE
ncbi:MAG TPA: hypothetical protein VLC92_06660 [Rhodocyclaceae bacterium]|nr:hypothetical protein [Rhodocyclaceae bacterium]